MRRAEIGRAFWDRLGEAHPLCECETVSVSKFSPGPIENHETLVSAVTSESFISSEGLVEPTIFENRISNGISTDRKIHTTRKEYDDRVGNLVEGNSRKGNHGSIELSVSAIRKINHQGYRAIAVYDTAIRGNIAHAEIVCTEIPPPKTPGRKKIRAALRKKILDAVLHDGRVVSSVEIFSQ